MWSLVVMMLAQDAGVDRELAERVMTQTPPKELIAMGREAVTALGPYRYRMVKQERVKGELLPAQDIDTFVQKKPFAVRLHYVGGPAKGRKVLYNPKEEAEKFRAREAGFLSIFGAVWVSVDSGLAKKDSNHTVKEAGLGNLLDRFTADLVKAESLGGMKVVHEGWDKGERWCTMYVAPDGGKQFSAAKSRICTDVQTRLPAKIESFDGASAVTERYEFSDVRSAVHPDKFFDSREF